LNAKVGYRKTFLKQFDADIYFSAQNITSEKYYQMVFVNQLPDAYLPGPTKINYFGGATIKYNF
jgi:iron complex outermembrane receptor protein